MPRGFYTIMAAQFFSSLADNALFVIAVELLRTQDMPEWLPAALVPVFALFYVVLAPWMGALADSMPKGRVMLLSNSIKVAGCLLMLSGVHPLLAWSIVGLGAAAYSPAKYGILTELLPAVRLVKANGWIEGLTIASIILGVVLGGQLVAPQIAGGLLALGVPGIRLPAQAAIAALVPMYLLAAGFNLYIPCTRARLQPLPRQWWQLLGDFRVCNRLLWHDKLGQIALATTTLFWGASANLRYIVLLWSAVALGFTTTQGSALLGMVAIGTAAGALLASLRMRLHRATRVIPLGICMGALVLLMHWIHSLWLALPLLLLLGGLGGFLIVPMNALLQHRGYNLMGAGRSIAVQNFNEQLAILVMGLGYTLSVHWGLSDSGAVILFALTIGGTMWLILGWHAWNLRHHRQEVGQQMALARGKDGGHHRRTETSS